MDAKERKSERESPKKAPVHFRNLISKAKTTTSKTNLLNIDHAWMANPWIDDEMKLYSHDVANFFFSAEISTIILLNKKGNWWFIEVEAQERK